jgi:hypothetical protein
MGDPFRTELKLFSYQMGADPATINQSDLMSTRSKGLSQV